MSQNRPHKRLSLTLPTEPGTPASTNANAASGALSAPVGAAPAPMDETATLEENSISAQEVSAEDLAADAPAETTVRVMAYLTPAEAGALDGLWLQLRRRGTRASKSDVLRAALTLAFQKEEELANVLSQQQVSTLSRQRSSKSAGK